MVTKDTEWIEGATLVAAVKVEVAKGMTLSYVSQNSSDQRAIVTKKDTNKKGVTVYVLPETKLVANRASAFGVAGVDQDDVKFETYNGGYQATFTVDETTPSVALTNA